MQETLSLFPTLVYKNYYSEFSNLKTNLFSKLESVFEETKNNNNVFMREGTLCSYHTADDLHKLFPDQTKDAVDFVESCAKNYWKECGYFEGLTPFVFQVWANKTPKGGYIDSHLHGNMPFTAVMYIDASPEQGNLFLENPLETVLMTQPISPNIKYPIGQEISVRSGDLIMFPGYLRHSVKANLSETPRLILGFNIGCKGPYWAGQYDRS